MHKKLTFFFVIVFVIAGLLVFLAVSEPSIEQKEQTVELDAQKILSQ